MNHIVLLGRLTKDVELRYSATENSVARANYTLAVNRPYKREGEADADFINIIAFGKLGEFAEKHFKKGQMVGVEGRLQIRHYDVGEEKRQYFTEVIAEKQHFADNKKQVN